jgi:hypothetical protein
LEAVKQSARLARAIIAGTLSLASAAP